MSLVGDIFLALPKYFFKLCCREKTHVGMELSGDPRLRKWTWVHVANCVDYEMGEKDVFFALSHNPALLCSREQDLCEQCAAPLRQETG